MLNNQSIRFKNNFIVIAFIVAIVTSMIASQFSVTKLLGIDEDTKSLQNSIVHNQKIISAHEKFMGDMCRVVAKNEKLTSASDHRECILGKWYYDFLKSKEFQSLPNNLQSHLRGIETSHKFIHDTAKTLKDDYIILDKKLISVLFQKELDHVLWANKLANSNLTKTVAKLETNPNNCAFGKWYNNFLSSNEFQSLPNELQSLFQKIKVPHSKLHESAITIIDLQTKGDFKSAINYYDEHTLKYLNDVQKDFEEIRAYIESINAKNKHIEDLVIQKSPEEFKVVISSLNEYNKYLEEQLTIKNKEAKDIENTIDTVSIIIFVFTLIVIFLSLAISSEIRKSIAQITNAIKNIADHNDTSIRIEVNTNDEMRVIADNFNKYLHKIDDTLKQDIVVIKEVTDIIGKVNFGFFNYMVKSNSTNPLVNELKDNINTMIKDTKEKLDFVSNALVEYSKSNFSYNIEANKKSNSGMYGTFGSLVAETKLIGNNVSEILAMIMLTGNKLDQDTQTLSSASEELSTASNEQAANLEETAAAMEEITSNIKQTVDKSAQMAKIAEETKEKAEFGKTLSLKTANAMDEINSSTSQIIEAITIIDQIAFQTNILSLNAAVEAATAGEAGRGFAVVAGEVRNLANRSAEAAKNIKTLVEIASEKANEGKETSNSMMKGFNELNDKINETSSMVKDVAMASREQQIGMEQINDAMAQLDIATQENARVSHEISLLATEVAHMASDLIKVASKAQFKKETLEQVCDVDLVYATSQLKLDHIVFKENNYTKLGNNATWKVVDHHSCRLGNWIREQESANRDFTKTNEWQEFKKVHEHVHSGVQSYIEADSKVSQNSTLKEIARDIEHDTIAVFDYLNKIKIANCREKKKNEKEEIVTHDVSYHKEKKVTKKIEKRDTKEPNPHHKGYKNEEWDSF